MFKDFVLKQSVRRYLRQLNNPMLKDYYCKMCKKNPKTHTDSVICLCCVEELEKRNLV